MFRLIIRVFVLFLTLSMSLVSFLGGLSAVMILSNEENIKLPNGSITTNIDFSNPSGLYIKVPFEITNTGYFDLEDLFVGIKIYAVDVHGERIEVFNKGNNFGKIIKGETLTDAYIATVDDFNIENLLYAYISLDSGSTISLKADIIVSAKYSLGLISFRVEVTNLDFGEL